MGQQQITGVLPQQAVPFLCSLIDTTSGTTVGWSPGATVAGPLPVQPPLGERWQITAWSISFNGMWGLAAASNPIFGRPGRLYAGIVLGALTTANQPGGNAYVTPVLPIATNAFTAVVWDGSTDQMFPAQLPAGLPPLVPITFHQSLAEPATLQPGDTASVAMWLTPSLGRNFFLTILNASYTITYDDGAQAPSGWGGQAG